MKRILKQPWTIAIAILAGTILWMLTGLQDDPVDAEDGKETIATAAAPDTRAVQVREQIAEPVRRVVTVNGRTAPARTVLLKAETSGRVVAVEAARGKRVAKGDVILRLDERDRAVRLAAARATLRQRELEIAAAERLVPNGYITEAQLAEARAALEIARAETRRAELDVEYSTIRAPFDGALEERQVEIGDYVAAGDPLATIVDERKLIVTGDVAEQQAPALRVGAPAEAQLVDGRTLSGKIRYIAPVADVATRTFTVELELDNRDGALPAGVTARMLIPTGTVLAHRVSPGLLSLDDEGRVGVKIVSDTGEVLFVEADVVRSDPQAVWLAGLPQAASVITVGQGFVRAGEIVQVFAENLRDGRGATVAGPAQP